MHPIARAVQHYEKGDIDGAIRTLKSFLFRSPAHIDGLNMMGVMHAERGDKAAAIGFFEKAARIDPANIDALSNLAKAQSEAGRCAEALATYDRIMARGAGDHVTLMDKGLALMRLGRFAEAMAHYDKSVASAPDYALAWGNRAHLLAGLNRYEEALHDSQRALDLRPDYAEALAVRGLSLMALKRYDEACIAFERSRALKDDFPNILSYLLHARMLNCSWDTYERTFAELAQRIESGGPPSEPFALLATPLSLAQIEKCTAAHVAHKLPYLPATWTAPRHGHERIRLGYFSSDFHDAHPVGLAVAGLIELHDRQRFEVFGVSFGHTKGAVERSRLEKGFDRFVDVGQLAGSQSLDLIRELEIDIAIDLNGHTMGGRPEFFLERIAPVQVNYLGYPATMGAAFMDYIVADHRVIPEAHRPYFSERIAYMPNSFFPAHRLSQADGRPSPPARHASRMDAGLPEDGFVFCCFNNSYKIEPVVFEIWMTLLKQVAGSVLWLSAHHPSAVENLRQQAAQRGVAPGRLIFAPRLPGRADHLRRVQLADLFLDTFYYNAHSTACDALDAGVPVLTCVGEAFAGRVAASLLDAVGLPELVATSHAGYAERALRLATHPQELGALRARLEQNRESHPLFDTPLLVRDLERAYGKMFERHLAGLPPAQIDLALHTTN